MLVLHSSCVAGNARGTMDCRHTYVLEQSAAQIEVLLQKAAHLSEQVQVWNAYILVAEEVQISPP